MIDYEQIPIWLRVTQREKIDPAVTPYTYRRREELVSRMQDRRFNCRERTIPDSVLEYISHSSDYVGASGMIGIEPRDLRELVKSYKRRRVKCSV